MSDRHRRTGRTAESEFRIEIRPFRVTRRRPSLPCARKLQFFAVSLSAVSHGRHSSTGLRVRLDPPTVVGSIKQRPSPFCLVTVDRIVYVSIGARMRVTVESKLI